MSSDRNLGISDCRDRRFFVAVRSFGVFLAIYLACVGLPGFKIAFEVFDPQDLLRYDVALVLALALTCSCWLMSPLKLYAQPLGMVDPYALIFKTFCFMAFVSTMSFLYVVRWKYAEYPHDIMTILMFIACCSFIGSLAVHADRLGFWDLMEGVFCDRFGHPFTNESW